MTPAVRLSRDEFRRLAQRALLGAGAPAGTDEDGAATALWLAERRLPGARACLDACRALAAGFRAPEVGERSVDARGMPALLLADGLLDLLAAEGTGEELTVERLGRPWTLPATAWRRDRGLPPLLLVCGRHRPWRGVLGPDELRGERPALRALCRTDETRVVLAPGRAHPSMPTLLSRGALEQRASVSRGGIRLSAPLHAALSVFAARTLVPADERSRLRGAGPAGETDD